MAEKNGRPTKYKKAYDKQAYKFCLLGATNKQLADFFEVNEDTIYEWMKVHTSFSEAIRAGKIPADANVAHSSYQSCVGAPYKKEQPIKLKKRNYGEDGKLVSEEEYIKIVTLKGVDVPNEKAIEFWQRNRQPELWNRDKAISDNADTIGAFKTIINSAMGNNKEE